MCWTFGQDECVQNFGVETTCISVLGGPRRRWEDNINTGRRKIGCEDGR